MIVAGFVPSPLGNVTAYVPTISELEIVVGVWAVGLVILTILYKVLLSVRKAQGQLNSYRVEKIGGLKMEENPKLIYFDNAATSWPKPEGVYHFMMDFYRSTGVNPGRSGFDMAVEAGMLQDQLRKRLTRFFGGDEDTPERLCFGYNATDALNLIIQGLLSPGDHVITTNLEHNSVIRPIQSSGAR